MTEFTEFACPNCGVALRVGNLSGGRCGSCRAKFDAEEVVHHMMGDSLFPDDWEGPFYDLSDEREPEEDEGEVL